MNFEELVKERSASSCELCSASESLSLYIVAQQANQRNPPPSTENVVLLCETCQSQIEGRAELDPLHWRCLNESMWSEQAPVQVLAWRLLRKLRGETWAQDLFEMLYLETEVQVWAEIGLTEEGNMQHLDSNGVALASGDSVALTKDLNVKGAGFTAKRGTVVRNISLVAGNTGQIEGRVNGQEIVILTQFVKKSG